jgi:replicative DNA helicase
LAETAIPPAQNLEAEESVLGVMMLSPGAIDAVSDVLEPQGKRKFYRLESHGRIYQTALNLHRAGQPVDAITLADALAKQGELDGVGGKGRIHELAALVPAASNAAHYARIVRDCWAKRALLGISFKIRDLSYETADVEDLLRQAQVLFEETQAAVTRERDTVVTMYDGAAYLDEKFRNPPDLGAGVPTPWSFLPRMHGGRLYVLGGYPADGKTVQASHFFRCAIEARVPTGFVTLEMNWQDLIERLAANMGLPAKRVQSGRFEEPQRGQAASVVAKMAMLADHGRIIDNPVCTPSDLRRYVKAYGLEFLIVDHLHMFQLDPQTQRESIEEVIRGIWQVAREFDIPVLLLAQLSRTGDKLRPFPRPTMAQIKGSGAIEQFAWRVDFVWRERDEMNMPESSGGTEYIIAKNRSGEPGMRRIRFVPAETRFEEIAREG